MYSEIYEFCKVRNNGTCLDNGLSITPRVAFIIDLLERNNIEYILDTFNVRLINNNNNFYNIYLVGNSNKFVVAHHDIVNHKTDNANDNSASVINAIMLKKLKPEINVALLDGEEFGGIGSQQLSDKINNGTFNEIKWVLNLELTGCGGENFFIGKYPGELSNHITNMFDCPILKTPFNDSVIFNKNGIDSVVINPAPILRVATDLDKLSPKELIYKGNVLSTNLLYNCHTNRDTIDTINVEDMKNFVEKILLPILR